MLTGNVLDAAVCYQKAIEQDPNKLPNQVVCFYCVYIVIILNGAKYWRVGKKKFYPSNFALSNINQ